MSSADVSLVVDFLNTLDVEADTDALAHAAGWRAWSRKRGLEAGPVTAAREARTALRAAVGDAIAASPLTVPIAIELGPGGPALVARDAVSAVMSAAARLAVLGRWSRVKICPADDCRWAFYDESRNRSRAWCSMQVCGNREKARSWRRRQA